MFNDPLYVKVFVSIPDDLKSEQKELVEAIKLLNTESLGIYFHEISWDELAGKDNEFRPLFPPQAREDRIESPSECELFVMVLRAKLARPFPDIDDYSFREVDGYESSINHSTEWEFAEACRGHGKGSPQRIFVFHCTREPEIPTDPKARKEFRQEQLKVEEFILNCERHLKNHRLDALQPYERIDDFRAKLQTALRHAASSIIRQSITPKVNDDVTETKSWNPENPSPFPGLNTFEESDSAFFFGRTRELNELKDRFLNANQRFVAIVGASGSGKSSLVRGGLLPRLRAADWRILPPIRPGNYPLLSFVEALNDLDPQAVSQVYAGGPEALASELARKPQIILPKLMDSVCKGLPEGAKFVLLIDQLEELFTNIPQAEADNHEPDRRFTFVRMLEYLADDERVAIIITLRADLFDKIFDLKEIYSVFRKYMFPLKKPHKGQLQQMIVKPALAAGLRFEDPPDDRLELPDQILEDAGDDSGAMPLIAYTLAKLLEECRQDGVLTFAAYDNLGGVKGIIQNQAQETFQQISEQVDDPFELDNALLRVFSSLVTVTNESHPARLRAPVSKFGVGTLESVLIENLSKARLLTLTGEEEHTTVEVAHEAIFEAWPTLKEWLDGHINDFLLKRQVESEAEAWDKSKEVEANLADQRLWKHERLVPVYEMYGRLGIELDTLAESVKLFIKPEAVRLIREIDERETRHRRRASIGDRLADIGDVRTGIDADEAGRPQFDWCTVEGGSVRVRGWTLPVREYRARVAPFRMSRYCVTYSQYRAFLRDGYANAEWWYGLKHEDEYGLQTWDSGNRPAENVSWSDAVAFCRWLQSCCPPEDGLVYRLPTVAEWVLAAKVEGEPLTDFPWGSEWDQSRANTASSRINHTVAVGMYPQGDALHGDGRISDLIGNVYEWCLNTYDDLSTHQLFNNNEKRIIVGNCWHCDDERIVNEDNARFDADDPSTRNQYTGFRVVMGVPLD